MILLGPIGRLEGNVTPVYEPQNQRSYVMWSETGRIYLTVKYGGTPFIKVDWPMDEVDAALNALKREILDSAEPPSSVWPVSVPGKTRRLRRPRAA